MSHLFRMNLANAFSFDATPSSLLWTTQPKSIHPFSLCPIMKANMLDIYTKVVKQDDPSCEELSSNEQPSSIPFVQPLRLTAYPPCSL